MTPHQLDTAVDWIFGVFIVMVLALFFAKLLWAMCRDFFDRDKDETAD